MEMVHFIPPSQRRLALLASQADTAPVLISGGNGTGKGQVAGWIHANGPRSTKPLVTAHHDATLNEQIPLAQGGTLLIPEIGEYPLGEQKALLDFLNTKSVPQKGGLRQLVNARIMATTGMALDQRAQGGLFNIELLEKLNVFRIEMPPLKKRTDEFEDITTGIMGEITRDLHKEHLKHLSSGAWGRLRDYDWPGNLRELRNVLRMAVVNAKTDTIAEEDLPDFGHDRLDFHSTREEFERTYILELLKTFDYEIERTCQVSRMDKATLLTKIKKYGIELKANA